jgi:dual-specificity kinase
MLYCGQELINGNFAPAFLPPGNFAPAFLPPPPIFYTGPQWNLSPPWRPDDKDGHYVFAVGENLTPKCMLLQLNHNL